MKQFLSLLFICIFTSTAVSAQDFSDLDKSPMEVAIIRNTDHSPMARIIYSSPRKKGREIFGGLVPYGEIWRTGANEATEITFYNDMRIAGNKIPSGTYTLYTIPNEEEWTIILNKNINIWGTINNYKKEQDLVRIKAPARSAAATIENFSVAFQPTENGTNLLMGWDDTFVEVPFKNIEKED
ncbi:DUF2911 domain-containing protein [Mesonia maritima]|uniref:Asparagine synthetase B n=1 Tax=Mesonia maritima TaxID=1793873 RepID=A0ABU1KBS3_9FLAO|nr:DUF2911 domain-containing protein [Mesonia maritima]MDR6302023.1 hypothetical protein [Mesonia maritima]